MLVVTIADEAAWARIQGELRQMGAAQLPAGEGEAAVLTAVELRFAAAGEVFAEATGQLVFRSASAMAVTFAPPVVQALCAARFPEPEAAGGEQAAELGVDEAALSEGEVAALEEVLSESSGGPKDLWARFEGLSKVQKINLARIGNADARRMVMKDKDRALHQYILANPGLSPLELAGLIKGKAVSVDFVRRLLGEQRLVSHPAVVDALVCNPHTPIKVAVDLAARLDPVAARRIARANALRPEVVSAARRRAGVR